MFIAERKKSGVKILELNGRIDHDVHNFESELNEMIAGELKILVDCSGLNFINSSGLRVFLVTLQKIKKENGKIVICNLADNIKNIFKISGFLQLFEVFASPQEAFDSLTDSEAVS